MQVPVRVVVRDAWHPVDVPSEGLLSAPDTPLNASLAVSRAPSPSDWVTSFSPAASPRPEEKFEFLAPSQSRHLGHRDSWVGVETPTEPTVGTPMEEEVEVKFGMMVEKDEVFVQLSPAGSPAAGAESSVPTPAESSSDRAGLHSKASAKQRAVAGVVVEAARFVLDKLRQLRSDAARAHLDLLKGGCLFLNRNLYFIFSLLSVLSQRLAFGFKTVLFDQALISLRVQSVFDQASSRCPKTG